MPLLLNILLQEAGKYNQIIEFLTSSLENLQKSITGINAMSAELDKMQNSLCNFQVPEAWLRETYPSQKPLLSWYRDLAKRMEFISNWLTKGEPNSYWLPVFIYPQAFLSTVLQIHARKAKVQLEKLGFGFKVLNVSEDLIKEKPKDGVYIHGLFIEAAKWNSKDGVLEDQRGNESIVSIPPIWLRPVVDYQQQQESYSCPVYKTSEHSIPKQNGTLEDNIVLAIDLPCKINRDHWVLRGTSILMQLNE